MNVVQASSSWRDQKSIIDYLESVHAEAAALRFLEALDQTIAYIAEFPDLGAKWESDNPRHAGLKYQLVQGFLNYVVIYRRYDQHVLITRVFHAAQDIESLLG